MATLVRVVRIRQTLAGVETSRTTSYFVSNQPVSTTRGACQLYDAIRSHWQIDTMYYRRDVVLAEDATRSISKGLQWVLSSLRTLTLSLLSSKNPPNMWAKLEGFADDVQALLAFLKLKRVL